MAPNQANKLSSTGVAAALSQLGHTNSSGLDSACCPLSTPPHAHSNCFPHRTPNPGWLALENESIGKGAGPRGFGTVGQGMLLHPVTPFSNDWSGVHVTRILDWAKEIVIISCLVGLQGSCCVARRPCSPHGLPGMNRRRRQRNGTGSSDRLPVFVIQQSVRFM